MLKNKFEEKKKGETSSPNLVSSDYKLKVKIHSYKTSTSFQKKIDFI